MESSDDSRLERMAGKRLRVEGQKRTEVEYRQMLRLCEIENQELKNSLRYVEIQLAKTKDGKRELNERYESAQDEITKCHENIQRQANINSAQAKQIEDMGSQLDGVANTQKEIHEKTKLQIQQYQGEIDIREMEINRIKKLLEDKDGENMHLTTELNLANDRLADIENEFEMKSGENNRLRKQVVDLEKTMQDLYQSRKGNGTLQIEMDSLKADNEKLLDLLKATSEYADMDSNQIVKHANKKNLLSGRSQTRGSVSSAKGSQAGKRMGTTQKDNDWIPTEAVREILKIKEECKGIMTEVCVSQILYQLNTIWRNIMRKENDAIKKRLNAQIQDLRRQIVTKQAFDKGELINEVSRAKKELAFANKKLHDSRSEGPGKAVSREGTNTDEIQNSIKLIETINIQKKMLEDENDDLKSRLSDLMNDRSAMFTQQNESALGLGASAKLEEQTFDIRKQIPKLSIDKQGGIY